MLYRDKTEKIIGAFYEVYNTLGCGFLEAVYQEALAIEFELRGIPFEREKSIYIVYKSTTLSKFYTPDFICYGDIIVEVKALSAMGGIEEAIMINYLNMANFKVGLLVNFGERSLMFKRMIN